MESTGLSRAASPYPDPAQTVWAHAVNSQALLSAALASGETTMLEADVLTTTDGMHAIMAHPPRRKSDLTLKSFLHQVLTHNRAFTAEEHRTIPVGIKLDFKDPDAVPLAMEHLLANWKEDSVPLWLNADVFQGPGGAPSRFDPHDFVTSCQSAFPNATLSLGFTTGNWGWTYTEDMVEQMLSLCRDRQLAGVTFALAARMAQQSPAAVKLLLDVSPSYTLTLWGPADDSVRHWMTSLPPTRTFIDTQEASIGWRTMMAIGRLFGGLD